MNYDFFVQLQMQEAPFKAGHAYHIDNTIWINLCFTIDIDEQ